LDDDVARRFRPHLFKAAIFLLSAAIWLENLQAPPWEPIGRKKQRIGEQSQTSRPGRHYFFGQSRRAIRSDLKET
jgi:hypothetical protein